MHHGYKLKREPMYVRRSPPFTPVPIANPRLARRKFVSNRTRLASQTRPTGIPRSALRIVRRDVHPSSPPAFTVRRSTFDSDVDKPKSSRRVSVNPSPIAIAYRAMGPPQIHNPTLSAAA
ncbi:hypothetical protein C8Q70DRAFT_119085 [Cubamyces menziesii]|nr:hypothetical protein C8Q70DRAFT_119085 [Cubamyces menziesii]